ncbi:MAG: bifunctional hydroxymethylpyrimidine kinase/phosphomethylpyrimidine kinase, partial [Pseudomonadota bacterium]
ITAVTAQNTLDVSVVAVMPHSLVRAQIDAVLSDIGADAIKIGMLANPQICAVVAEALKDVNIPIVLDPVMVSTSGSQLLDGAALQILKTQIIPLATVITPNLPEFDVLAQLTDGQEDQRSDAALRLAEQYNVAVLVKDGHGASAEIEDVLIENGEETRFTSPRLSSDNTHGTGCTLSTAIACGLAKGQDLKTAVQYARDFVFEGIRSAPGLGKGHGPLNFLQSKKPSASER